MACKYCSIHIEKFNTQAVFQTFTAKLDKLIDAEKMVEVATDIAHGAFIINEYQCVECKRYQFQIKRFVEAGVKKKCRLGRVLFTKPNNFKKNFVTLGGNIQKDVGDE